jgi:acyl dehydratase
LIDEPLSARWRYDLGQRKILEFRSALGLPAEGPAPSSAVFAYGIVPGIARALVHPPVATHRDALRLARVEAVFASELDLYGELICAIDLKVADHVVAVMSCVDGRGARAVATIHLRSDDEYPTGDEVPGDDVEELTIDPGRCVAFGAATWDLNPAYWDKELAEAANLGGLVAPPGLPFALTLESLERRAGFRASAVDVHFHRAARPGDRLRLNVGGERSALRFVLTGPEGIVLSGTGVLGHAGAGL